MAITQLKKKKVSKKLKSSWRKHVNITDVEEFLEEKRLEERLGPLSSLPNDSLFQLDIKPSNELLYSKQQRKLLAAKPLKCFSALQSYTSVPDPISKRNRVRTKEERRSKLVTEKLNMKTAKKLAKINTEKANTSKASKKFAKRGEFNVNLWEDENNIKSENWVETNTNKHNLRGSGVQIKKIVRSNKKTLPAVETPHPGMSYNPSYGDHQDLLQKVAAKEQKLIKEEKHLNRVTRGMFSRVTEAKRDQDWLVDMSEGLPSKGNFQTGEEHDSDGDYKSVNPPSKNVKKTLKQKRKKREQLELEKARKSLKLQKKKVTDIHNIKMLVKHVEIVDEKQTKLREVKKKNKELKKDDTKMLNAMKYEEPDLEFTLGREITGNLKNLKTEGNLLEDRFKSMQKRNILAPTKRHKVKRGKVKKYTKPDHKDENWKKSVARTFK